MAIFKICQTLQNAHNLRQNQSRSDGDCFQTCPDSYVKDSYNESRRVDPLLKLYHGRPMMLNLNEDVQNKEANGTVGFFENVQLKQGVTLEDLELIRIDGYWVRSACVSQVDSHLGEK